MPSPSDEYNQPSCTGPYAFRTYTTRTVPPDRVHPPVEQGGPAKTSYMRLELDLPVSAILNRRRLTPRNLHHDFIELLHPDRVERGKNVRSVRELWEDEQRRRSARGETGPFEIVDNEPREWDERPPGAPVWKREPEFRAKVKVQIDDDLAKYRDRVGPKGKPKPDFATYVDEKGRLIEGAQSFWLDRIRTSFEQVDAVYVERFREDEIKNYPFGAWAVRGFGLNVTEAQEATWLHAGHPDDVDVDRLHASQAAGKSVRLKRRPQDRVGGSDDEDEPMDADSDPDDVEQDGRNQRRGPGPPATQAEALAQARRRADVAQMRGREASVEEGEWEREPDEVRDEDDDGFWGMGAGTDRPVSPALGEDDEEDRDTTTSPASRRSSVHPASVSPTKPTGQPPAASAKRRANGDAAPPAYSPAKRIKLEDPLAAIEALARQNGSFGQQAASFLPRASIKSTTASPPGTPPGPELVHPLQRGGRQQSRGSTSVIGPQAKQSPRARPARNPFSSPAKAVSVRMARPAPVSDKQSPVSTTAHLFDTNKPLSSEVSFEQPPAGRQLHSSPSKALIDYSSPHMRSSAPPIEHFLQSSPSSDEGKDLVSPPPSPSPAPPLAPVKRARVSMTASQIEAEFADLPEGALDDDYHPTPTVTEEGPSQLPLHMRTDAAGPAAPGGAHSERMTRAVALPEVESDQALSPKSETRSPAAEARASSTPSLLPGDIDAMAPARSTDARPTSPMIRRVKFASSSREAIPEPRAANAASRADGSIENSSGEIAGEEMLTFRHSTRAHQLIRFYTQPKKREPR